MPRAPGQIDEQKSQAILEAATDLFGRKGAKASMAEIAKLAGVSKQTLYNRYPTKAELARTLLTQRAMTITAPLDEDRDAEQTLAIVGEALLSRTLHKNSADHLRALAQISREDSALTLAVFEAGPAQSISRISNWLRKQTLAGHLSVANPDEAAEVFIGMILGHSHLRLILGLEPSKRDPKAHAIEVARRFVRAYAT